MGVIFQNIEHPQFSYKPQIVWCHCNVRVSLTPNSTFEQNLKYNWFSKHFQALLE
jgi:hypothetical protein